MSLHMPHDIAVVGIAHKLPHDVEDDAGFWEILAGAKNQSCKWPEGRMNSNAHPHPRHGKLSYSSPSGGGHFIRQDPAAFDAPLFGLTAKEAASMDPVQRWTLEVAYRAFENAGIPLETLKGSQTAVLSATFTEDYMRMAAMDPDNVERTAATGCLASVIPNRVSYFFGMHGPSIHVDTACSSALSAFDMACKVLSSGDAEAALVTAANLILEPGMYHMFNNLQMLSPDYTCKAFDHKANGFGRGEGVLAFVLKPVSQAIRDGDMIRAVVRGVASNQDGHTPALSQPNPVAQEELIKHVYSRAGLGLNKTRYVEAHGTGTPVGDPIEMEAIGNAFREGRTGTEPLYVGSVKSNIGHLEGASGLAGILKAILILEKGIIPPNALFEKLNPAIDAELLRVQVPNKCIAWPSTGLRRVSVNGFGFGGSNTHVILDDARHFLEERGLAGHHCTAAFPDACNDEKIVSGANGHTNGTPNGHTNSYTNGHTGITEPKLLVFSAFDEETAKYTLQRYSSWYQANNISSSHAKLNALAHTLAARRSHLRWRSFAVASPSSPNLLSPAKPVRVTSEAAAAWIFTGQGAQYIDMGWGLADAYPVFKDTLTKIDEIYQTLGNSWSIFDGLKQQDNINKPEYCQPLSTAVQLGLVDLLRSFGLIPKAVVGHSSGEIAAAYAAGALSLTSACKVSYFRGLVAGRLHGGSMISVNMTPDQVPSFLSKTQTNASKCSSGVSIACINSPFNITLSGPEPDIDAVKEQAVRDNIFARKVNTGVAYHSEAMCTVADEYLALIGSNLQPAEKSAPDIPIVSTVTGKKIDPIELSRGQYWRDNMVSPVMFASGVRILAEWRITDIVEVGPHPALRRYVQDSFGSSYTAQYCSALYRGTSATEKVLELAGILFTRGHTITLSSVNTQTMEGKGHTFLVSCPPYPFDHSKTFWAESRISRDYRLRAPTKGDLLGQRVSDWNPLQPRWRNFLSVESSPWIGHHVIGDTVLFPAAGMIVMALEAVREVNSADQNVGGYFVRNAHFLSPIIVPRHWDERVETMLSLTPVKRHPAWSDITMFAYDKDKHTWTIVFDATVQVQYAVATDLAITHAAVRAQHSDALQACTLPIDSQLLYNNAADHGLQYGDWFRLCEDIRWDKAKAQAIASVCSNAAMFQTSSVVHPAILDTVFHILRASAGLQRAANVPIRLEDAWFASVWWQASETNKVRWLATSHGEGRHGAIVGEQGSASALADDGTVLARIETLTTAAISTSEGQNEQKKLLYGVEWQPQLSLLSQRLPQACEADAFPRDGEVMLAEHRQRTAVLNMVAVRHVRSISEERRVNLNDTLRHHIDWLEQHVRSLPLEEVSAAVSLTNAEFEAQLDSFAEAFPDWTLYSHVARSLAGIVDGEIDPLQVIFESDHAKTFYSSLFHTVCGDGRLDRFMQLAAHETPSLRILEVGAGTGGMTTHVLNALKKREKRTGAMAFSEYMYTDISPVFFESAKARWDDEGFGGRIAFKTLDMEESVLDQGFGEHTYDLLIAGSCVHATRLLDRTLSNLRRLLRTGGKLVLLEVTDPTDIATCFFATLASGWWLSQEEWRMKNKSPLASEDMWDRILRENGFSGNDLVLRDTSEAKAHIVSVIVSTALHANEGTQELAIVPKRIFVVDPQQSGQKELASILFKAQDVVVSLDDLQTSSIGARDVVVSLVEVDQPFLASTSEERFIQLQTLIKQVTNLIWVTAPRDGAHDVQFPHYCITHGFLRTVRAEVPHARIVLLAIEDVFNQYERSIYVQTVIETAFGQSPAADLEYAVRSGLIHTARAVEDVDGNTMLNSLLSPSIQEIAWKDGPATKLTLGTPCSMGTLQFEQDELYSTELGPHEIEIEARAWGLSKKDALCASGQTDRGRDLDDFGSDCAGVITRVGRDCDAQGPQPGDPVVILARGCIRKFPRAHEACVVRVVGTSFATAVAMLQPVVTAYHALVGVARVRKADKVLIHEADSAMGQMAVQVAQMNGAEVFVTLNASSDTGEGGRELLGNTLGVAPSHIFPPTVLTADIRHATQGHGVDIVVGAPIGDQRLASLQLLAPGGRFVNIGGNDLSDLSLAGSLARNVSFATIDVLDLEPQVIKKLLKEAMGLFGQGKISRPSPTRIFPAKEVANAFKAMQDGDARSRFVIVPRPGDVVRQLIPGNGCQGPWKFDENATYLIPGGLGGIGRSILAWMAARGAKHLAVPSRSGASSAAAKQLVSSLQSRGVNVFTPKCNISNEGELTALLDCIKKSMPAIRGVINCAMVLTNAVFVNMTFEQWSRAIEAKVNGSFNLHRLLPQNNTMDFFVHLASLAGVNGQMASANYAAGCTFQDALAQRYPGTTVLDVGWIADIGLIAETAAYQRQLRDWGNMQMVEEKELLEVLGMACNEGQAKFVGHQVLVGLLTPADYLAKGKEPPSGLLGRPLLSAFAKPLSQSEVSMGAAGAAVKGMTTAVIDHGALFRAAADDRARASIVSTAMAEKLARAMMMSADNIDPDRTLSAYGVDSLMAVELRNWIVCEFGAVLGMWEIMSGDRSIKGIAEATVQKSSILNS